MKFRQVIMFISCSLLIGSEREIFANRLPTHYAPDLEVIYDKSVEPYSVRKRSVANIVLDKASKKLEHWNRLEENLSFYDLDSIHGRTKVDFNLKKRTVEKAFLKYLDKSLMEKVNSAKAGSALSGVRSAKTALSPKSEKSIAPNFKLKFRAKVLRGRGQFILKNPYADANALFSLSGRKEFYLVRNIELIGAKAMLSYIGHENRFYSELTKPIIGGLRTFPPQQGREYFV